MAWKAKFPGEVSRSYLILNASRILHVKNGTQHRRNVAINNQFNSIDENKKLNEI